MISRSDGMKFHLLLADRPIPYPIERASGETGNISICFWYSHVDGSNALCSTIVILPESRTNHPSTFRMIEAAADRLAEELAHSGTLAEFYEFIGTPGGEIEECDGDGI